MQTWTLIVEVEDDEAPSELIEALAEIGVGTKELHCENLLADPA